MEVIVKDDWIGGQGNEEWEVRQIRRGDQEERERWEENLDQKKKGEIQYIITPARNTNGYLEYLDKPLEDKPA